MFTKSPFNSSRKTMHLSSYPHWLEACTASCLFLPGRDWRGATLQLSPGFNEKPFTKRPSTVQTQPQGLGRMQSIGLAFPPPHVDAAPDSHVFPSSSVPHQPL